MAINYIAVVIAVADVPATVAIAVYLVGIRSGGTVVPGVDDAVPVRIDGAKVEPP